MLKSDCFKTEKIEKRLIIGRFSAREKYTHSKRLALTMAINEGILNPCQPNKFGSFLWEN